MATRQFALVVACCLAVYCQAAGGPFRTQLFEQPPMQAQGIIVKFLPGTFGHDAFVAAASGGPEAEVRLRALGAQLSADSRIPVRIQRLTSGREFVLAVDSDGLASSLVEYLSAQPEVLRAHSPQPADQFQRLYWNPRVVAEIRAESPLGKALDEDGADPKTTLNLFAVQISNAIGFPVRARANHPGEFVIDISGVATELLERLKQRPDVEYAQLNLLMRPLPDGGSAR